MTTWTYGGAVLRARAGDRIRVAFSNDLPHETSVHWHGLAIRNAMDGVRGLTMAPVAARSHFAYDFVAGMLQKFGADVQLVERSHGASEYQIAPDRPRAAATPTWLAVS